MYSLENKLIQLNKSLIIKLNKNDWQNDYKVKEMIDSFNA